MNDKASAPVDHLLTANNIDNNMAKEKQHIVDGPYAKYVLGLLVIMGYFQFHRPANLRHFSRRH